MPAVSRRVHYQVSFSPPPDKCNYVEKCSSMGFMLAACTLDLEIRVRVHGSLLNLRADYSEGVSMSPQTKSYGIQSNTDKKNCE